MAKKRKLAKLTKRERSKISRIIRKCSKKKSFEAQTACIRQEFKKGI